MRPIANFMQRFFRLERQAERYSYAAERHLRMSVFLAAGWFLAGVVGLMATAYFPELMTHLPLGGITVAGVVAVVTIPAFALLGARHWRSQQIELGANRLDPIAFVDERQLIEDDYRHQLSLIDVMRLPEADSVRLKAAEYERLSERCALLERRNGWLSPDAITAFDDRGTRPGLAERIDR
jgi:hypothetical protein